MEKIQQTQSPGEYTPKKDHESLQNIVYFCLVVVALGFIALVISYLTATQAAFNDMGKQISSQNTQIGILTNEINDLRDLMRNCNARKTTGC